MKDWLWLFQRAEETAAAGVPLSQALRAVQDAYASVDADRRIAEELDGERWLPVVGWEGLYEVSDLGRVRSLSRTVRCETGSRRSPGKVLAQTHGRWGEALVALSRHSKARVYAVRTLVLTAFVGPPQDGQVAVHRNDDKGDHRLVNLRWGTRSELMRAQRRPAVYVDGRRYTCLWCRRPNVTVRDGVYLAHTRPGDAHGEQCEGSARRPLDYVDPPEVATCAS